MIALPATAPEELIGGETYDARAVIKDEGLDQKKGGVTWGRLFADSRVYFKWPERRRR